MSRFVCFCLLVLMIGASYPVFAQHDHGSDVPRVEMSFVEMMQSLGEELNTLTQAVIVDDFVSAHDAAYAIATHGIPQEKEMARLMMVLGDKADAFKTCDGEVHRLAMATAMAAHKKEGAVMMQAYTDLVSKIRICHHNFRSLVQGKSE